MNYMNHNMIHIIHFPYRWRHTSINKNAGKQYYYLHKYIHVPYCEQIHLLVGISTRRGADCTNSMNKCITHVQVSMLSTD